MMRMATCVVGLCLMAACSETYTANTGTTNTSAGASVQSEAIATRTAGETTQRSKRGLGPDTIDVQFGTRLSFGQVGRVCAARGKQKGKKVDKFGKGRNYVLYDSNPNSTAPRTFYVTGFADNCPRQFTAALALFGAPSMHESLRYGRPQKQIPYSDTDRAYERVKSRVCGVGRRKPCGSSKLKKLERNTVFISTYERFTNNGRWGDFLLHNGKVMAAAVKKP